MVLKIDHNLILQLDKQVYPSSQPWLAKRKNFLSTKFILRNKLSLWQILCLTPSTQICINFETSVFLENLNEQKRKKLLLLMFLNGFCLFVFRPILKRAACRALAPPPCATLPATFAPIPTSWWSAKTGTSSTPITSSGN